MIRDQSLFDMDSEIISTAIEQAFGWYVDIAINHDMDAISMHMANHPQAERYCAAVFEVDLCEVVRGRAVGHLHCSPDCAHHSQAMIDTPPHGIDDEPCWYCGGTGEDQRRLCPNCQTYEPGEPSSPNPLKEG